MSFTSQPTPGYVRSSTPTRVLSAFLEACQQGLTMSHSLRVRGSKPFLQASSALDKKPTQSIAIDATATCTHRHFPPSSLTSQVWLALYCPPRKLQTTPLRLSDLTFLLGMEGLLTDSETQSSDFIWGGGWINSYSRHATIFLFLRNYGFVPLSNSNTVCIHRNNKFRKGQQDRNVRFLQPGLTHFLSYRAPNQPHWTDWLA